MNHKNKRSKLLWLAIIFPILALACSISVPDVNVPITQAPNQEPAGQVPATQAAPSTGAEQVQTTVVALPTATTGPTPTPVAIPQEILSQETLLSNLYGRVRPSVVLITVYTNQGGTETPFAEGSGFVYDTEGHIVTNAHVVHGADQVEVTFSNDTIEIAKVLGEDLNADLAVVQVKLPEGVGPLPLGDMTKIAVGQTVIALGNPFGLESTLTQGVVSALGRTIPALTTFSIPQAIQTDAAINPGNSGGPLLNLSGEVIGVNAQIQTGGQSEANSGVGFAIPVSIVQLVVPDLIKNGTHEWTWLGVSSDPRGLSPLTVQAMNLPVSKGVYISQVTPNGPADQAGLRGSSGTKSINNREVEVGGDVITAIDGQPVNTFSDLLVYLAMNTKPGQKVTLTIIRDGKSQDVPVTLQKRPENLNSSSTP